MILSDLKLYHVRNITSAHLQLSPNFNCIVGPNGSGKTSVLEALYILACGHSFRTREISTIISHNHPSLTVFSRASDSQTISIQKSRSEPTLIKLNNQLCKTTSQLAYALPAQVIFSDLFSLIDSGPSVRRSVLDWGLFHVKHDYFQIWKDFKNVLKQRNALLKTKAPYSSYVPWDKQLSELAYALHSLRSDYFSILEPVFQQVLSQLTNTTCSLNYYKGWGTNKKDYLLIDLLNAHFESDKQRQYTQYGPHHADIIIQSDDKKAKTVLSRGQQKIILIALKMAQCIVLDKQCLCLLDDCFAELDAIHQDNLMHFLSQSKNQCVFTLTVLTPNIETYFDQGNIYSIHGGVVQSKSDS